MHPAKDEKLAVIDGQQRLTSLLLLIKALFAKAGTSKELEGCLRIQNRLTKEMTDELRISSEVLDDDRKNLTEIVLGSVPDSNNSQLAVNYRTFLAWIDEWRADAAHRSADDLQKLISALLCDVVLLPIKCSSEDDALTIFETINNRGLSLSDADIFKAKLYHHVPAEKQAAFIDDWTGLGRTDWLFRIYMHILRAEKGDTGKETGLRSYFTPPEKFAEWEKVMENLIKINTLCNGNFGELETWSEPYSLQAVLEAFPNQYWNYPFYVFLHKHGSYNSEGSVILDASRRDELTNFMEEMVRYYYLKGLVYNAANSVKDATFKACAGIAVEGDYLKEFRSDITADDKTEMRAKLDGGLGRYQRGLVLLASYLNPAQDKKSFSDAVWTRFDIEHILPKKWNNFDGWGDKSWEEQLNSLGNLMPLEKKKNISASNEFLKRKKKEYSQSNFQDARDIAAKVGDNGWTPERVKEASAEKKKRLTEFFRL